VKKLGYQLLGYWTWHGMKKGLRLRYGDAPRKLVLGSLLVAVVAALVIVARKAGSGSE
jgi:hypothetical protein